MRPLKIAAPLAALALLTSACGLFTHHAGKPALKPVWKIANGTLDSAEASVVGDTVIARVGKPNDFSVRAVFIDGRTGRIRGRATNLIGADNMGPQTDKRGRPLVGYPQGIAEDRYAPSTAVYDPSGHLVWEQPRGPGDERYVGGYTAEQQKSDGKYWVVIRTTSGRPVTRLREPKYNTNPDAHSEAPQVRAVRPGLLAAIDLGPSGSHADLVDVSRPGHARLRPLRPPPIPSHHGPISPQEMAVSSGHLYVSWRWVEPHGKDPSEHKLHAPYIAGYDVPGARLAWHTALPTCDISDYEVQASTGGEEILAVAAGVAGRVWFLRPDTGALIGPKQGRDGKLPDQVTDPGPGLVGGRAYIDTSSETQVIDPRTGSVVRTIPYPTHQAFVGATSSGNLIYAGKGGLYAYR